MSSRPLLSRPRTRVYDANYNIGESYYKSALDRLDRKYSGRPLSPPPRQSSLPANLLERHERAFAEEDLASFRKRAEKQITEDNFFDSRGARVAGRALNFLENDIDEETASTLKRIRANKKVSLIDDVDLESTVNNLKSRRLVDKSERILDAVGVNESSRRALDEDVSFKRRSLRVSQTDDASSGEMIKWTPLVDREEDSAAVIRARQSRARINDIEEEMAALSEKQAARERRVARLKALVAENEEEAAATAQTSIKSVRISARKEKKTVEF